MTFMDFNDQDYIISAALTHGIQSASGSGDALLEAYPLPRVERDPLLGQVSKTVNHSFLLYERHLEVGLPR